MLKTIEIADGELKTHLDEYKDWVFSKDTLNSIKNRFDWPKATFFSESRPEYAASVEYLESIDEKSHVGFPMDMYGLDFNYTNLRQSAELAEQGFYQDIRQMNIRIDEKLQTFLGAKASALKAYYPENGYIGWHTNWNSPGYNLIFSYSKNGDGYWRHIDPKGSTSLKANTNQLVQIEDQPGWHCKAGYFGSKQEMDKVVWHSIYTREPRLTLSYVFSDEAIWQSMVEELEEDL